MRRAATLCAVLLVAGCAGRTPEQNRAVTDLAVQAFTDVCLADFTDPDYPAIIHNIGAMTAKGWRANAPVEFKHPLSRLTRTIHSSSLPEAGLTLSAAERGKDGLRPACGVLIPGLEQPELDQIAVDLIEGNVVNAPMDDWARARAAPYTLTLSRNRAFGYGAGEGIFIIWN